MMQYFTFVVTFASIIGTIANSFKKRWCFYVWLCTNAFWCIYNAANGQAAQSLLYAFNFVMAIIGIVKWKQPTEGEKTAAERLKETDREG